MCCKYYIIKKNVIIVPRIFAVFQAIHPSLDIHSSLCHSPLVLSICSRSDARRLFDANFRLCLREIVHISWYDNTVEQVIERGNVKQQDHANTCCKRVSAGDEVRGKFYLNYYLCCICILSSSIRVGSMNIRILTIPWPIIYLKLNRCFYGCKGTCWGWAIRKARFRKGPCGTRMKSRPVSAITGYIIWWGPRLLYYPKA